MTKEQKAYKVFRDGFVPQLSIAQLDGLWLALANDDPRIIQGATCSPPPLQCAKDWPCESACIMGFSLLIENQSATVAEVEDCFAALCFEADKRIGEPAACRHFLNWFDDGEREQVRNTLMSWITEIKAARGNEIEQSA